MKALIYFLLAGFFALMLYTASLLPPRGDAQSPINRDLSAAGSPVAGSHYSRNAYRDADTDNIVTVVLADYRSFDTLGETFVVFTAGVACLLILRARK